MDIFELIFIAITIFCAIAGGRYFGQWGVTAGFAEALTGLITLFIIGRLIIFANEKRFSETRQGKPRSIAEDCFDKSNDEKGIKSFRIRPPVGSDGLTIVMIFYGETKPAIRAFCRFTGDSMEPQKISYEEAALHIQPSR